MHVAVVGAGPLGLFYATHLRRVGAHVTVVRRRGNASVQPWRVTSRITRLSFDVELPVALELPSQLDVVVIAVRAEQLTAELMERVVAARARAIVCFTPALGAQLEPWRAAHPELVMAMPAVAAETLGQDLGYWVASSTLIEQRDPNPALQEFVSLLRRARIPVRYVADARARTLANTVALFPVHVAIFLEPSFRRWSSNDQLLAELAVAIAHAHRLAVRVGTVEWSLRCLAVWFSRPWRIRCSVWLLVHFAPQLSGFLEHHFGPKLAAQHALLQRDVEALARDNALPSPLPQRWVDTLAASGESRTELSARRPLEG